MGADFPYTILVPSELTFSLWTRIVEDLPEEVTFDLEITMLERFPQAVPCVDDGSGNVFALRVLVRARAKNAPVVKLSSSKKLGRFIAASTTCVR